MTDTTKLRFRLMVDFKEMEAMEYRMCREHKNASGKLDYLDELQAAADYLYEGFHGHDAARIEQFEDLESKEFYPDVDLFEETKMPTWEDIVDLANHAITAFNGKEFGMTFSTIASEKGPHCVRWVRKEGGKLELEYNWDLEMETWTANSTVWNRLPISPWDEHLPAALQILQNCRLTCRYRMTATYGWDKPTSGK